MATILLPMLFSTIMLKMIISVMNNNNRNPTMMSKCPRTWTSLQLALAAASAYVVYTSDLLRGAAIFLH